MTTNETCRLQIQKQKDLNANISMDKENPDEMYVNFLTEKELDDKIKQILDSNRLDHSQKNKIRKYFNHIKETGWFSRFSYNGYQCAVELDSMGRWRVFFKPKDDDFQSPLFDHKCNCCYCGYYGSGSSRFGIDGFPLGLWDYSDKIGLDDFIGLSTFSESDWIYDYFRNKKRSGIDTKLFDIDYAVKMCKKLVDYWIKYQNIKKTDSKP